LDNFYYFCYDDNLLLIKYTIKMMESNVMKKCQFCKEDILFEAEVCKYCNRSQIDNEKVDKIIDDLSQKKYRTIFMITVFIAFSYSWWMSSIAIISIIVISALIWKIE